MNGAGTNSLLERLPVKYRRELMSLLEPVTLGLGAQVAGSRGGAEVCALCYLRADFSRDVHAKRGWD